MKPLITLREALTDPALLGGALPGESFSTWRTILAATMGEPLSPEEAETFRKFTDRDPPSEPVREAAFIVGRRGGKDRAISALGCYLATCCSWPMLSPGETGRILCIAPDQSQARVQRDYVLGALESSPLLSSHIASSTADSITMDSGIVVEVRAASFRRLRGVTAVAVVASETAFWFSDDAANPDTEILAAVRPTLLTTKGMLFQISTPYAKRGELWEAHRKHFGQADSKVLVVRSRTATAPAHQISRVRGSVWWIVGQLYACDRPSRKRARHHRLFARSGPALLARVSGRGILRRPATLSGDRDHRRSLRRRVAEGAISEARHYLQAERAGYEQFVPRALAAFEYAHHCVARTSARHRPTRLPRAQGRAHEGYH
jgi:hypothetical protein